MVLCGHVGIRRAAYSQAKGDGGNVVHQMLSNYQMLDLGGRDICGYLIFKKMVKRWM